MKKIKLLKTSIAIILLCIVLMGFGCRKSSSTTPHKPTATSTTTQIIYSMYDTLTTTNITIWSVANDGTNNKKLAINTPENLYFTGDIALEVSTDNKTMVLSLGDSNDSVTYFYNCNIDGSNVQQIPNVNGYLYLQTFISPTTILYWKNADNGHNGELWQTNTDGSGNQQISIALPTGVNFGDGKFAKVTADRKTIFFSTFGPGNTSSIYKCNIDGSGLTLVTSPSSSTSNLEAIVNTNSILYYMYANADELWLVNLDGTNNRQVPLTLPTGLTLADADQEVAGNTIFFVTQTVNDTQAIYSAGIDGTNVKLLASVPLGYGVKLQGLIQ